MAAKADLPQIDIADIVCVFIDPRGTVGDYFGSLIDALFNRPVKHEFDELLITKTDARRIYLRAYPKAKV
jgi:hypothetical protein